MTINETIGLSVSASGSLKPGDQSLGWARRWEVAQSRLNKLLEPRTEEISGAAIKDARDDLLAFYVQTFHIKDALKVEAPSLGLERQAIEDAVTEDPVLPLLNDLANRVKHYGEGRKPASGDTPEIVEATGSTGRDGWRLDVTVRHRGKDLDGLQIAVDAIAAWRRLLSEWKLI